MFFNVPLKFWALLLLCVPAAWTSARDLHDTATGVTVFVPDDWVPLSSGNVQEFAASGLRPIFAFAAPGTPQSTGLIVSEKGSEGFGKESIPIEKAMEIQKEETEAISKRTAGKARNVSATMLEGVAGFVFDFDLEDNHSRLVLLFERDHLLYLTILHPVDAPMGPLIERISNSLKPDSSQLVTITNPSRLPAGLQGVLVSCLAAGGILGLVTCIEFIRANAKRHQAPASP